MKGVDFLKDKLDREFELASSKAGNQLAIMCWDHGPALAILLKGSRATRSIHNRFACKLDHLSVCFCFILSLTHGLNPLHNEISHLKK